MGLQRRQFEQLFGLDSKRLVEGGRDIAEGRGEFGKASLPPAAGLAGLRALARAARKTSGFASTSFTGTNQSINKALSEYDKQLAVVRENTLPPETYAAAATPPREAKEKAEASCDAPGRQSVPGSASAATLPGLPSDGRSVQRTASPGESR